MIATFFAASLIGCAGSGDVIAHRGDLLVKAGFDARAANTAERQEMVGRLAPNRFLQTVSNGHVIYLYADLRNCHCLYVGSPQAYSGYRQQMLQMQLATDEQMKSDMLIADWTASENRWEASGH